MLYYRLAEALGYVSVGKMLGEVTSEELAEWVAYFSVKAEQTKEWEKEQAAKERAKRQGR